MRGSNAFDVFDIVGPIMIGPSSSHTAGAVRIGLLAGQLCNHEPTELAVFFHGSLARTYSFHKTDVAVVAGVMGIRADDERIKDSINMAQQKGIRVRFDKIRLEGAHPSSILIEMVDHSGNKHVVKSATIGGGNIHIEEINGYKVDIDGKQDCLVGLTEECNKKQFEDDIKILLGQDMALVIYEPFKNMCSFKLENGKAIDSESLKLIRNQKYIKEIHFIKAVVSKGLKGKRFYNSCRELVEESEKNNCSISETVVKFEAARSMRSENQVLQEMKEAYSAMKQSIEKGLEKENELLGNIFRGNAAKMDNYIKRNKSICGISLSKVIRNALAVMEVNGSMGKVVACPTAGSAGTVPAAVFTVAEENNLKDEDVIKALFTGAGIGIIIAENASISGSVCGCQGECGAASAMAAAIITELFGGDYDQILSSVSLSLGNVLGMVCDPVAGMVEIPCIQRNAISAVNAILSAEMALAGVDSVIPADEMIGALNEVGELMDERLKDTLGAGISNTPTARKIEQETFGTK
ncbi:L-serine ammonia-lyase, iron-sulfur-dependent, subunit alpha [Lutispora saccharofermentans]|uniref:L-serine dehydratase n=1 Tax=Lutispora saccharofermentans TaxID=3024236 RepID=A0ABT1NDI7_9FIRM|nr:L-serine ammonia-lyase, iron-sulfur-dependent, subunit alpha [Lutispora saccharofermentans]MCQ1529211.1 L-serine ammonia-lyase, iron-sulfur-dependent, subunit alpha [Lutispora saccharofermentans]